MSTTNEMQQLRDELKKIQDQTQRSRKRAAFGFGFLVIVVILSFIYAFVQQVAAERNAAEALRQRELGESSRIEAAAANDRAQKNELMAMEQQKAAQAAMSAAQLELEKCRKGKR